MKERIKVALVGAGVWGGIHAEVYAKNPNVEFVAVCDRDEQRAASVADAWGVPCVYTDAGQLVEQCDFTAVGVATPDHAHRDVVIQLAQAGKKILVEKPLATTVDDCQSIIAAVDGSSGASLMVDFHCRWVLPFMAVKDAIQQGELGEPQHAFVRLSDTLFVPRKMLPWAASSNPAWFLAVHCIDLLRWFYEDEVVSVYSVSQNKLLASEGIDCADYYQTLLTFRSGKTAFVENSWLLPERSAPALFDFRCEVVGTKGAVFSNLPFSDAVRKYTDNPASDPYYPSVDVFFGPSFLGSLRGGAHEAINAFVENVAKGTEPQTTGHDGLQATRVVSALLESAQRGEIVPLE